MWAQFSIQKVFLGPGSTSGSCSPNRVSKSYLWAPSLAARVHFLTHPFTAFMSNPPFCLHAPGSASSQVAGDSVLSLLSSPDLSLLVPRPASWHNPHNLHQFPLSPLSLLPPCNPICPGMPGATATKIPFLSCPLFHNLTGEPPPPPRFPIVARLTESIQ